MQNNTFSTTTNKLNGKLRLALCSTLLIVAITLSGIAASFALAAPHALAAPAHAQVALNQSAPGGACIPTC